MRASVEKTVITRILLLCLFLHLSTAFAYEKNAKNLKKRAKSRVHHVLKTKPDATSKKPTSATHHRIRSHGMARLQAKPHPALSRKHRKVSHVNRLRNLRSKHRVAKLTRTELGHHPFMLSSHVVLAIDEKNASVLFEKNSAMTVPIASLTKLMTALVVVESKQNMRKILRVSRADIDTIKHTSSRLRIGAKLSRKDMLLIALMSSENRAAAALSRYYPGGRPAFVAAMNAKAKALGMNSTRYVEPTGLSSANVSSARDLAKLVIAARRYPLIARYSTHPSITVNGGGRALRYVNSNRLIGNSRWEIGLQKTGYIREAGRCLVMHVKLEGRPVVMVFLDSEGTHTRFFDASLLRKWVLDQADS